MAALHGSFHDAFPDGGVSHDGPNCGICGSATELVLKSMLPEQLRRRMSFTKYIWCPVCAQLMAVTKPEFIEKIDARISTNDSATEEDKDAER